MKEKDVNTHSRGVSPDPVEVARRELDRRIFHLNALYETARELSGLTDLNEIMENFLLTAMGTLGMARGFLFSMDARRQKAEVVSRGMEPGDVQRLQDGVRKEMLQGMSLSPPAHGDAMSEARLVAPEEFPEPFGDLEGIRVLIHWQVDREWSGLMGVGAKLSAEAYSSDDAELILSLCHHFITALKNARSAQTIRELNRDLLERNEELEEVVRQSQRTQKDLDRRLFHLQTLYDTARELSGLTETQSILETFLLLVMGAFSLRQGYILLLSSEEETGRLAYRGIEARKARDLSETDLKKIAAVLGEAVRERNLTPGNPLRVAEKSLFEHPFLPLLAGTGILFAMDETDFGFIGIGGRITEESFSDEEMELLLSLVNNFSAFLGNAALFERIHKLNVDLEKRNLELRETVEELTASRLKIEVLERAKARIRSVVRKEMERIGRVSAVDFLLMIGLGLVLGLIFNVANPNGIPITPPSMSRAASPRIDAQWAKLKYDTGAAVFVDARPSEFYERLHIEDSLNLPLSLFDFVYMMKLSRVDPEKEIIVYGRNISRLYDEEVAHKLALRGHKNVKILSGGLAAWEKKGYPLEP